MKKSSFLPEEILAITAGKLTMLHYKSGATFEFISEYVRELNIQLKGMERKVEFSFSNKYLTDSEFIWEGTYFFDEEKAWFIAKENRLFKVLEHHEFAENKIMYLLYDIPYLIKNKKEYFNVQEDVSKKLQEVFETVVKRLKIK